MTVTISTRQQERKRDDNHTNLTCKTNCNSALKLAESVRIQAETQTLAKRREAQTRREDGWMDGCNVLELKETG